MTKGPRRRIYEDPEFARLFEASEKDGPSTLELENALSHATQMATTSRLSVWGGWKTGLVIGLALMAVFARLDASVPRSEAIRVVPSSTPIAAMSVSVTATATRTVSVDDLAAVPIPASAAQRPLASARPSGSPERGTKVGTTFDDELALVSSARSALEAKDVRHACKPSNATSSAFGRGSSRTKSR